jgi:hypothetical protein
MSVDEMRSLARGRRMVAGCYNRRLYGGYSSEAERRSVAPDVVGSTPTSRPN